MATRTLGFVGIGRMGAPMAARLLAAGHAVTVFDPVPAAVQSLVASGAIAARSPREVADQADVVFASLPTPDVVRSVALADDGIVHGTRVQLFVDLSTTGPRVSAEVAAALAKASRPVTMIDCPVSGGVAGAAKGALTLMVAGPDDRVTAIRPLLEALGRIYVCGERAGQAQMVKVANNLTSVTCMAISCEMLVLGARAGVDPQVMMEVINVSSGRNAAMQDKVPRHILSRTFDFGFSTALSFKDARLCLDEAEALGVPLVVGNAARQVLMMTRSEFGADADFTNMARLFEQWAGVELRAGPPAAPGSNASKGD
jgi:3-hydroxyisobutyrate dehydrogenase/2-hydroxy-3-oxopropionate reductase